MVRNKSCHAIIFSGDYLHRAETDLQIATLHVPTLALTAVNRAQARMRHTRLRHCPEGAPLVSELPTSSENNDTLGPTKAANLEDRVGGDTPRRGSVTCHAMVLLGGRKVPEGKKTKIYSICQNSWPNMELVVCPRKYLEAYQAKVLFRVANIGLGLRNDLATSPNLIVDCASPYSGTDVC